MNGQQSDTPILICFDASDEAERAIDAAAKLFGPQEAVVLDVAPPMTFAEGVAATSALVPGTAFEDLNTADALQRADSGAVRARGMGLHAEPRATSAPSSWQGIVDVADEIDASVIVIGSGDLRGFRELAHGSVAHDVATHAGRPVLIVPPPRHGTA